MTVLCTQPLDTIKTFLQRYHLVEQGGAKIEISENLRSLPYAFSEIYSKYGITGFYAGWRMKFAAYSVNCIFTISSMEYLDNLSKGVFNKNKQ